MKNYVASIEAQLDDIEADNEDEAKEKFMEWFDQTDLIDFVEVEEKEEENTEFKAHCPKCGFLKHLDKWLSEREE